jgi:hypothetical protein
MVFGMLTSVGERPRETSEKGFDSDRPTPVRVEHPYRSAESLTRTLAILLGVWIVLHVVALFSGLAELDLLRRAQGGEFVNPQEALASDNRQGFIALAVFVLLFATAIVFIIWIHRLYKNVPSLGMGPLRYGTGWAIGAWFVPIWAFFRPKQIVNDIWRASDNEDGYRSGSFEGRPVHGMINLWWVMFLISARIDRIGLSSLFREETIEDFINAARADIASSAFEIPLAMVTIFVVIKVSARQRAHAAHAFDGESPLSKEALLAPDVE